MSSIGKQLALAVLAKLNAARAADPSPLVRVDFEPESRRLLDLNLIDETLRVWVVAPEMATSKEARDTVFTDHTIEVGIVQRVSRETLEAECDVLEEFAENIHDLLLDDDYDDDVEVHVPFEIRDAEISPKYDHQRLFKQNHFISIVRCTYRADRLQEEDDE